MIAPMSPSRKGYLFAVTAVLIFAVQDGISKHLAELYPPVFIAMVRYIAFAAFVLALSARAPGGIRAVAKTKVPVLQWARGILLAIQIVLAIECFRVAGLIQSQAIFAASPIFVALLSMPILGEKVGWRRWLAIVVGLAGVVLLLTPQAGWSQVGSFGTASILPLIGAVMLGGYGIMTRLVSRVDSAGTTFFYTGIPGAVVLLVIGPFFWSDLAAADAVWILILCITGMTSHYLLIRAYELLDAVVVQPVAYLQLVAGAFIGVFIFGEILRVNLVLGAVIVVAAGVFTAWREHVVAKRLAAATRDQS